MLAVLAGAALGVMGITAAGGGGGGGGGANVLVAAFFGWLAFAMGAFGNTALGAGAFGGVISCIGAFGAVTIGAAAVVTYSTTGSTTLRAAREKPVVPILGLTPNAKTARRLAIVWGVHSVHTDDPTNFADMVERACRIAFRDGFARAGQRIVVTAGVPFGTPGATNILRIAWVGDQRDAL